MMLRERQTTSINRDTISGLPAGTLISELDSRTGIPMASQTPTGHIEATDLCFAVGASSGYWYPAVISDSHVNRCGSVLEVC